MSKIRFIGLDVHAGTIAVAVSRKGEPSEFDRHKANYVRSSMPPTRKLEKKGECCENVALSERRNECR
jgi:hypothetical protein